MAKIIAKVFIIMTLVFEGIVILGMSTFIPVFATICTVAALAAVIYQLIKKVGTPVAKKAVAA